MTYKKICAESKCEKPFTCNNECKGNFAHIERVCFCSKCIKKDREKANIYKEPTKTCSINYKLCPQYQKVFPDRKPEKVRFT